jgi:hypothetical protein
MRTNICLALAIAAASGLWAQNVISARSGLIHYVEGNVTLEGQKVKPKNGEFPIVEKGQTLATEDARAEVLLTPGVFLRLGSQSSFKMVSNLLSDTRLEVLSGTAIIEVDELPKGNSVVVLYHDAKISPLKHGLYRLDVSDNRFRVFDGEAQVIQGDQTSQVKAGHQIEFGSVFLASKFDRKVGNSLDGWAANRSQRIAQANVTAANMVSSGSGGASSYTSSNWVWNPYFGLFTYLPSSGFGYNPYGWAIYSPRTVSYYYAYQQPAYYGGNNGNNSGNGNNANNGSMRSINTGATGNPGGSPRGSMSSSAGLSAPASSGMSSGGRASVSAGGGRGH